MSTGTTNYPAALDSQSGADPFASGYVPVLKQTALSADLSDSATTINVVSTTGFETRGVLAMGTGNGDTEHFSYTGVTATSFTGVTRAFGGTTARAHLAGAMVAGVILPETINNQGAAIVALESEAYHKLIGDRLIVNGNYDHWQRVESGNQTCTTSFSAITSFGPDRMFTLPAGASVTVARSTTVPSNVKSVYSCAITGAASVTTVDHGQRIRAESRARYKRSLVFLAYIRNESGAAFTPTLRVDTPAGSNDWTTPTNRLAQTLQSCADSAWTLVYHVFDPSAYTNIDNGMSVYLRVPSGSLVSGDIVRVAQFDLRPGVSLASNPPYQQPDPEIELLRCLPYYRKSYNAGVALQTDTTIGLAGLAMAGSGATNAYIFVPFGAPMWKIPTIRLWDKAGTANQFYKAVANTNHAGSASNFISSNGFMINNNTTATEDMWVHYDAVAELT